MAVLADADSDWLVDCEPLVEAESEPDEDADAGATDWLADDPDADVGAAAIDWLVLWEVDSVVDVVADWLVAPLPGASTALPSVARVVTLAAVTS